MKIALIYYGFYVTPFGGGAKADRFIIESLASSGHECCVLIPTEYARPTHGVSGFLSVLDEKRIPYNVTEAVCVQFELNGVSVTAVHERTPPEFLRTVRFRGEIRELLARFQPDIVLVSGSDRGLSILRTVLQHNPKRVVYFARCTQDLGVGPRCVVSDPCAADTLNQVGAIVSSSHYLQEYLYDHCDVEAIVADVPVYGFGEFVNLGNPGAGLITIVNPCTIKGLSIFVDLARDLPELDFGAVPTWGTTRSDRVVLASLSNVAVLPPSENIEDILKRTRVLLVPSLWDEVFGRIVIEAMVRGIPVIASNVGGLPEAKLNVPYLINVTPITAYREEFDERRVPIPYLPKQDISEWRKALRELTQSALHYRAISDLSRSSAMRYIAGLSMAPIENLLVGLERNKPL